eukprot:GFUD01031680.1.p1 GENE.GFUD01031680.1~~GFUD01031680.1.p1  ORF type:complete len:161 (-),score=49.73 GFUD01031680.1:184-666(-)
MSRFEQVFYSPWFSEISEATKFHPNNKGLPAPSPVFPTSVDQFVFNQTKSDSCASCVDAQCGKLTKFTSSSLNAPNSSNINSGRSSATATNLLVSSTRAVLRDKLTKQCITLKNADLEKAAETPPEIVLDAGDQAEVTGQMAGTTREIRVIVGKGRSKNK